MKRVELRRIPLRADPFAGWGTKVHSILFALFVVQFLFSWARLWPGFPIWRDAHWPYGLLVVLTAATVLASLSRQLPAQNVMLASCIIAFIAGAVESISALSAIPFGPFLYTSNIGPQLFYPLPWAIPLLWLVAILTSRGIARLILRPWRKTRNYGFWLMGVTALLVVLFDFNLEPFATRVKQFWYWNPTKAGLDWYGAPWVNFFAWAMTTLLILAFATPTLINKKPVKQSPEYHSLTVWLLMNLLFGTGCFIERLWPAVLANLVLCVVTAIAAIRGARW